MTRHHHRHHHRRWMATSATLLSMLLFLWHVVILDYASAVSVVTEESTTTTSSSSSMVVLISTSTLADMTFFSCFVVDTESDLSNIISVAQHRKECCENILSAATRHMMMVQQQQHKGSLLLSQANCQLQLAEVPQTPTTTTISNRGRAATATAFWSWVVPIAMQTNGVVDDNANPPLPIQFLYRKDQKSLSPIEEDSIVSPYHLLAEEIEEDGTPPPVLLTPSTTKVTSRLDPNGGMHRLLHHSLSLPTLQLPTENGSSSTSTTTATSKSTTTTTYYIYVVVPQGMFIDLNDPLEMTTARAAAITATPSKQSQQQQPGTAVTAATKVSSFDVVSYALDYSRETTTAVSFSLHLHAAKVCDIEQPAFVSGQHVLVWQLDNIIVSATTPATTSLSSTIEFATKLHLRYPDPSPTMEQWLLDLPQPMLFELGSSSSSSTRNSNDNTNNKNGKQKLLQLQMGLLEPACVAAGNSNDHDWVMWVTIASCLVGVVMMLQDISKVSLWDDV